MSTVQHAGARTLLEIIQRFGKNSKELTYTKAAQLMGKANYERHSRAVAQMCDLLDAAAYLAGVPLVALVAVKTKGGEINSHAWAYDNDLRTRVIQRSLAHMYTSNDFQLIRDALDQLTGLGNRKAWKFLHANFGDSFNSRLLGDTFSRQAGALDDLGTDDPLRVMYKAYSYLRDPAVRTAVLVRAAGVCEFCGAKGFQTSSGEHYLETHHIIALAKDGADRTTNVIALCANDHRRAHFGEDREVIEHEMLACLDRLCNDR